MKSSTSDSKVCTKCGVEKPYAEFHKKSKTRDGLNSWCKFCNNDQKRKWRAKNLERARAKNLEYYHAHRDRCNERTKKWIRDNYERHRETQRKYEKTLKRKEAKKLKDSKKRGIKNDAVVSLTDNERLALRILIEEASLLGPGWHLDHIVPLSKGGSHHPDNLQIVRASYNLSKRDKLFNTRKYY